jgi:hypothetical protein
MAAVGVILIALGVLIAYEAVKSGFALPAEAALSPGPSGGSGGGTANNSLALSNAQATNYIPPSTWASMLRAQGLPESAVQHFMAIIQRESNYFADATCWAPGADASQCTQYQKQGDTQAAMGGFQFLGSTWAGYGCSGSPYNPLDAVTCAARAWRQNGFGDWGG